MFDHNDIDVNINNSFGTARFFLFTGLDIFILEEIRFSILINLFLFVFKKIVLNFNKQLLHTLIKLRWCDNMFYTRILSSNFLILHTLWHIPLTTDNINQRIWHILLNLTRVVSHFIKCLWISYIIYENTCIWTSVITRNDSSVSLLATGVVIIVPCVLAFLDVKINW